MNIVFDLGGVLFTWKPKELIEQFFDTPRDRELIYTEVQAHRDWDELDRGAMTYDELAHRGGERTGIAPHRIARFLEGVPGALQPVPDMVDLLTEVKAQGHHTYLLSNMHTPSMNVLEQFGFMNLFDGKIYSCRVHQLKPNRDIYETLLNTFHLKPAETVFIDDTPGNLSEPAQLGIKTIAFLNPAQCQQDLEHLGVYFSGRETGFPLE